MWEPPPPEHWNGLIREYIVNVTVTEGGGEFQLRSNTTMLIVEGLHPYYTYNCLITAVTLAPGPFSVVYTVRMPQDSEFLNPYAYCIAIYGIHNLFCTVPSVPPRNVAGEALSSSTISVTWESLVPEGQNGVIISYTIVLLEVATNVTFTYEQVGLHTELVIDSLHPFYEYECAVSAATVVGLGPSSAPFIIQTMEDSKCTSFYIYNHISFLFISALVTSMQFPLVLQVALNSPQVSLQLFRWYGNHLLQTSRMELSGNT